MQDSEDGSRWCDLRESHRRPEPAQHVIMCKVEGKQLDLCSNHRSIWVAQVQMRPELSGHCPNCAHLVEIVASKSPRPDTKPLAGPLADALDNAMLRAGVLVDKRQMVLKFLSENNDPYVGSILRTTSGVAAIA